MIDNHAMLPELRFDDVKGEWVIVSQETGEVLFSDRSHSAAVIQLEEYRKKKTSTDT